MMRKVTQVKFSPAAPLRRRRVAAYARVSSGKDAMLQSLSAQVSYYNDYIGKRGDWEFAGVYADDPVTGTKDTRLEFQRMLEDCRAGKIDMIITKSITRFARNTVILLKTVRELKLLGVDVFFEKENIHTSSADGEVMLTLLASYAQEESRSVSENQKWRIRRMFEAGRPNTGRMLGYRLFDGKLHIVPEEAKIVRRIYADYLSGMGKQAIAKVLNREEIPTIFGGLWRANTIHRILTNEKYTGDMLLQKTFRENHMIKVGRVNQGELPMYHVNSSHEAIIDHAVFEQVQQELKCRATKFQPVPKAPKQYPFSGLLQCGLCGAHYRRRIAAAGSKYAKPAWICNTFNVRGKGNCPSQQIPEKILMEKTSEVLGLAEFGAEALKKHISAIQIPGHNRLAYIFRDGHTEEVVWQNPSRRHSWTDEMKQAAREQTLKRNEERKDE